MSDFMIGYLVGWALTLTIAILTILVYKWSQR